MGDAVGDTVGLDVIAIVGAGVAGTVGDAVMDVVGDGVGPLVGCCVGLVVRGGGGDDPPQVSTTQVNVGLGHTQFWTLSSKTAPPP